MAAQITVIVPLCLSCYFSSVLLEEEENQCTELHLSPGSFCGFGYRCSSEIGY